MKPDILRRVQAKKGRRRPDNKGADTPSKNAGRNKDVDVPEMIELEDVGAGGGTDTDARNSKNTHSGKRAKKASEAAMQQKFLNMMVEQSDIMVARQRSKRTFVAVEPDVPPESVSSNAVASRGPKYPRLNRAAAASLLLTAPAYSSGQTLKDNPDGWTECIIKDEKIKKLVRSITPEPIPRLAQRRHRIRDSPASRAGVFATKDLKLNDLIYSERPLLITPTKPFLEMDAPPGLPKDEEFGLQVDHHEEVLEMAWGRMQNEAMDAFMALPNLQASNLQPYGPFMGIKKTNEHAMWFERKGDMYSATYNQLSRVKHSCLPNAVIHFNIKTFAGELRALGDVKSGEEILISFCHPSEPVADRKTILQKRCLVCKCRLCTDPEAVALRQRAEESVEQLDAYLSSSPEDKKKMDKKEHEKMLKESSEWVEIIEKEGMQGLRAYRRHLEVMGSALMHLGRVVDSLQVGEKRVKLEEVLHGDLHGTAAALKEISRRARENDPKVAAVLKDVAAMHAS